MTFAVASIAFAACIAGLVTFPYLAAREVRRQHERLRDQTPWGEVVDVTRVRGEAEHRGGM